MYEDFKLFSVKTIRYFLNQNLITCTLCVISILPESIPLVPYFFKAWHLENFLKGKFLTCNSQALDKAGCMDTLVVDKTGILTENKFRV